MGVILKFFRKRVGEAGEAAQVHPHSQILPLHVAGRDVAAIGFAGDGGSLGASDARGAIPNGGGAADGTAAVVLLQRRVVHLTAKRVFDGCQIHPVAVCRQLHAVGQSARHVSHEVIGHRRGAGTDHVGDDQLSVRIKCRPRPAVAPLAPLLLGNILLLRADETPDLVTLNPLASEASDMGIMVGSTGGSQVAQQFFDGHSGDAGEAGRASEAVTLDQGRHNRRALLGAQLIHTRQYTCTSTYCQVDSAEIGLFLAGPSSRDSLFGDSAALGGRQRDGTGVPALGCAQLGEGHSSGVTGVRLLNRLWGLTGSLLDDLPRELIGIAGPFFTCSGRHSPLSHVGP